MTPRLQRSARLMASLSVRCRTSLLARPLGILPTFGDTTCAQDAVAATTSSSRLHRFLMPKALPPEDRTLSERCLVTIGFCPFSFLLSASVLFFGGRSLLCLPV